MKHEIIDYTKLVVGQKLWDIREGEVVVKRFDSGAYPIICRNQNLNERSYTNDGRAFRTHLIASLYLNGPLEAINEFPRQMEVCNDQNYWVKRTVLVYNKDGNNYIAFDNASKMMVVYWQYAREIQQPVITEYTLEEIATKLGVDVNSIRIKK